jgi:hypothetical protein
MHALFRNTHIWHFVSEVEQEVHTGTETIFLSNESAIIAEKFRKIFAEVEALNPILCLQYYN